MPCRAEYRDLASVGTSMLASESKNSSSDVYILLIVGSDLFASMSFKSFCG